MPAIGRRRARSLRSTNKIKKSPSIVSKLKELKKRYDSSYNKSQQTERRNKLRKMMEHGYRP